MEDWERIELAARRIAAAYQHTIPIEVGQAFKEFADDIHTQFKEAARPKPTFGDPLPADEH